MKTKKLPTLIRLYSDGEFISAVNEFKSLNSDEMKVDFIVRRSSSYEGLLSPLERNIDGVLYRFGFDVKRRDQAYELGKLFIGVLKGDWFNAKKAEVNHRFNLCRNDYEIKAIIDAELKAIETRVKKGSDIGHEEYENEKYYAHGYLCEESKRECDFLEDLNDFPAIHYKEMQDVNWRGKQGVYFSGLDSEVFYLTAEGAWSLLYSNYLKEVLRELSTELEVKPSIESSSKANVFNLDSQYEKVLFIQHAGLYNLLEEKIGNNKVRIAKAISAITGELYTSIKSLLYQLDYNRNSESNMYKEEYVVNVLKALRSLKLETSELDEIYSKISIKKKS